MVLLNFGSRGKEKPPAPFPPTPCPGQEVLVIEQERRQILMTLILRQLRAMDMRELQAAYDRVSLITEARHGVSRISNPKKL